ncbi:MAG TPA: MBL fold metallo-hydrolase [Terriglobales bacterium]|nr:MBL fold metallo-hydrolase [Terriglobales bacterium]
MRLSFHGAAGDVTGSCHLLEAAGKRILIDCGLFQGSRRLHDENAGPLGFDAASVDSVLLTHAHLDHCGRIPLLYHRGYKGKVLTTAATLDLARIVLLDAAALSLEELKRNHQEGESPLYTAEDVAAAMGRFDGSAAYGASTEIAPGIRATFQDAGHILGSAWILIEVQEGGATKRIVFSGDLGNRDKPILEAAKGAPPADVIVMESTYGDRNHRSQADSIAEFRQAVVSTLAGGGNVVIPTFAIERAQDLLYYLREMVEQKVIPATTPVYLDSPMAISTTEIFRRHRECFNRETAALLDAGHDPFTVPGLQVTRDRKASAAINAARGAVILAGSGMATGGRILHHLRHNLGDARNRIVFVGYAAAGTLARQIIDGAKEVKIYGEPVTVHAGVSTIGGFSAHADHDGLLVWAQASGKPGKVFLVHGEAEAAAVLAKDMAARGLTVTVPKLGDVTALNAADSARA